MKQKTLVQLRWVVPSVDKLLWYVKKSKKGREINECFENIPGVVALVDDRLLYGKTQYDQSFIKVLEWQWKLGIKFDKEKIQVAFFRVKYSRHILISERIEPDLEKISAIKDMPAPTNKTELETILGMINYLSKFIPNLSEVTSLIRQLLGKNTLCFGGPSNKGIWKDKGYINFKPKWSIEILWPFQTNKSPTRCLPTQPMSCTFTGRKANCICLKGPHAKQKELCTNQKKNYLRFCRRFHGYLYRHNITIEFDHKPFVPIFDNLSIYKVCYSN